MILFNDDMDRRLADIQAAGEDGVQLKVAYLPEHSGSGYQSAMPPRLVIDLVSPRRVVLDLQMAAVVANQLEANGLPEAAEAIRAALP